MLYGRRLDESLEHVDGSRYALVHAVAKRARQITLWLTADPTELRAESAPPPAAGEFVSRDPVALAENEIIQGEVLVRWDPEGRADERDLPEISLLPTDPLLLDTLSDDDDDFEAGDGDDGDAPLTPALAQALAAEETTDVVDDDDDEDPIEADPVAAVLDDADGDGDEASDDDIIEVPLQDIEEDGDLDEEE